MNIRQNYTLNLNILEIPDLVAGLKVIYEEVIAAAIADDQSAFKNERRLEVEGSVDLKLTLQSDRLRNIYKDLQFLDRPKIKKPQRKIAVLMSHYE